MRPFRSYDVLKKKTRKRTMTRWQKDEDEKGDSEEDFYDVLEGMSFKLIWLSQEENLKRKYEKTKQ